MSLEKQIAAAVAAKIPPATIAKMFGLVEVAIKAAPAVTQIADEVTAVVKPARRKIVKGK
jgi:hypothetical protein